MRWGLSWALYLLGDLWCEAFVVRGLGTHFEWPYSIYHRLMCWSSDLQGASEKGPWAREWR